MLFAISFDLFSIPPGNKKDTEIDSLSNPQNPAIQNSDTMLRNYNVVIFNVWIAPLILF
jgi:hypothetical protein